MSRSQPGVLFTINDSGHEPVLYAVDTAGADRGAWRIAGARNDDWEALAPGPCTPPRAGERTAADEAADEPCLYIGDVGDNAARHPTRVIYRVREPQARGAGFTGRLPAARLEFRYADGPHDVEGMVVAPDATILLVTKRRNTDRQGRPRPALMFALSADAWTDTGARAVALLVDSLPIVPGSVPGRLITDAALSPDAARLAVRTYREVWLFHIDPVTARVRRDVVPEVCDITGLRERQGEGITWMSDGRGQLLTSEGRQSPMHVIACGEQP